MDAKHAIHAHPQQAHWNGSNHNKKQIIKRYKKNWRFRNGFWLWRHAQACFNAQFLLSYFQSGALALENIHANLYHWFYSWMKKHGMGLEKAAAWQYQLVLKSNQKRANKMVKEFVSPTKNRTASWPEDWINKISRIYDYANSLTDLKQQNLCNENNGHAFIEYYDKNNKLKSIDITLKSDLRGI